MTKQTAVEWLVEQYVDSAGILTPIDIQNALQIERKQIEQSYLDGLDNGCAYVRGDASVSVLFEKQYYEQVYGKETNHEL